jgi:RecB family exonuclease
MQFLRQVAEHYFGNPGFQDMCFIFPNRRSQVFFRKHIGEAVKAAGRPIVSPKMLTINDFFYQAAGSSSADRVRLLLILYDCYSKLYKDPEPLDEFIFWGDILIGDFDDVDKYLVDAKMLFANVSDFKAIQDDYEYLTETQRKAISQFMSHFRNAEGMRVDPDSKDPNVKERFLRMWQILWPLYKDYKSTLTSKGIAYEGMVYRKVADRLNREAASDVLSEAFPKTRKFIFVGHNALNECERTVMRKMRDAGLAEFCWDFSSDMIKDRHNKASLFLSKNVEEFGQAFDLDPDGLPKTRFEVISVPSSVGQAKILPELLSETAAAGAGPEDGTAAGAASQGDMGDLWSSADYSGTAVVIPDETLLVPVLNSIPPEVKDINVTMGYPMRSSAFYDFLSVVNSLQLHMREKDGKWYFYHKQVWDVLSSGIFQKILAEDEAAAQKAKDIKKDSRYYVSQDDLQGIPLFDLVFRPAVKDPKSNDKEQVRAIEEYQLSMIAGIAKILSDEGGASMDLEFAKAAYNAVNQLKSNDLAILPLTYFRLFEQLISPISVPFNGEPLKGLQIMGPLETRALDFKHIFLLSCNEGIFPHRSVSSSFVPPELRKGFGLPTYELQDAVWAYYFYRMIQRAETVTMIFDSRTEGLKVGEESRYIKQLEYHFNVPLKRSFVKASAKSHVEIADLPKTENDLKVLQEVNFSASTMKSYLDCPAMFYFSNIKKLSEEEEVVEDVDAPTLGNIFHSTMQALYLGEEAMDPSYDLSDRERNEKLPGRLKEVTKEYIDSWLKRKKDIKARIRSLILSQMHTFEVSGRDLVTENVILQYVLRTLKRDRELLEKHGVNSFRILGLERFVKAKVDGFNFVGFIDRMDSFLPGQVRIVDYKTGKVADSEMNINDENAEAVAEALFAPDNEKRPKIAFQLFIYDYMISQDPALSGQQIVNSIYQPLSMFRNEVLEVPMSQKFNECTEERLHSTLAEMRDPGIGWRRTNATSVCAWCSFKNICGR